MINKKWYLFILFCVNMTVFAQQPVRLRAGVETGYQIGWWLYFRGSTDKDIWNTEGWDRTHYDTYIPINVHLELEFKRFLLGIGTTFSWLNDDEMIREGDTPFAYQRYTISNGWLNINSQEVYVQYDMIDHQKYQLSPRFTLGTFQIHTLHPEKENFGRRILTEFSFVNTIQLHSKWKMTIRPLVQVFRMAPKETNLYYEYHRIYDLGFRLGLNYTLK